MNSQSCSDKRSALEIFSQIFLPSHHWTCPALSRRRGLISPEPHPGSDCYDVNRHISVSTGAPIDFGRSNKIAAAVGKWPGPSIQHEPCGVVPSARQGRISYFASGSVPCRMGNPEIGSSFARYRCFRLLSDLGRLACIPSRLKGCSESIGWPVP